MNFEHFDWKIQELSKNYICSDLSTHALLMQNSKFRPYIDSEQSHLQEKKLGKIWKLRKKTDIVVRSHAVWFACKVRNPCFCSSWELVLTLEQQTYWETVQYIHSIYISHLEASSSACNCWETVSWNDCTNALPQTHIYKARLPCERTYVLSNF